MFILNTKKDILTSKNFILFTSKLHTNYEEGGQKIFKNAQFLLIGGKFWENVDTGVIIKLIEQKKNSIPLSILL